MTISDIPHLRLYNQYVSLPTFDAPADVVAWLGAVQAQDYAGALWAVGLRTRGADEKGVEKAVADKTIVRTWPMRGTLHFVAAADVRWMIELLTPRVIAAAAYRRRFHELDEPVFAHSRALFGRALAGGKQLRRDACYKLLEAAKISTAGGRGLHILSRLALDGLLCFGAREGKQPTFALLDEWAPAPRRLSRDESLAELARRYFTSHGPVTVPDFVWWSGLTSADARAGLEMAKAHLVREVIDGQTYWLAPSTATAKAPSPTGYLLPPYDEYTVAYKDRSAVLDPLYAGRVNTGNGVFGPIIVVDGQVVGIWKRAVKKGAVAISLHPFTKLNRAETRAVAKAADRYGEFLGVAVALP
jgi:hypothetical protein